jgi:hypothetical protein
MFFKKPLNLQNKFSRISQLFEKKKRLLGYIQKDNFWLLTHEHVYSCEHFHNKPTIFYKFLDGQA